MEPSEDKLGAIYMILLLRPDMIYILPGTNKLYMLNGDQSDLIEVEIDSVMEMTDEEVNIAIQKKLSE